MGRHVINNLLTYLLTNCFELFVADVLWEGRCQNVSTHADERFSRADPHVVTLPGSKLPRRIAHWTVGSMADSRLGSKSDEPTVARSQSVARF